MVRYDALAACDGTGLVVPHASAIVEYKGSAPAAVLLALGVWNEVDAHPAAKYARRVRLPGSVLIPGMVNAHTHLDLTHIGPQPHDPSEGQGGFVRWVDMIRSRRHTDSVQITASVRQGIQLSLAGGVVAVGDIAGAAAGIPNLAPYRTLAGSPLHGVSFLEFFGIGSTRERSRERVEAVMAEVGNPGPNVKFGLQPHAPNTVDLRLYRWVAHLAAQQGFPLATHLAETPEERQFIADARGPQRAFLERLGIWDDSILEHIGKGRSPMRHMREVLSLARFTVAHVNDADDDAIDILARTQTSVAYCPRASEYFNAERHFGPHRYGDMLKAGINVALGTDSIVNLPASSTTISVLDEARLLFRRDGADPVTLLRMATLNGAAALELDPARFRWLPGQPIAGIVAIEIRTAGNKPDAHPFALCLESDQSPILLWNGN